LSKRSDPDIFYIPSVECEVEFSDEFGDWWSSLDEDEQDSVRDIERTPHAGTVDTLSGRDWP